MKVIPVMDLQHQDQSQGLTDAPMTVHVVGQDCTADRLTWWTSAQHLLQW